MSKKNLGLNPKIDIDFPISETVTIQVSYKELKGKREKELSKKFDKINKKIQEKNKLNKRINILELKAEALFKLGENEEVVSDANSLNKLYDKLENVDKDIEALGGYEKYEEFHKEQFEKCVESKDFKKLTDAIEEESSYFDVMQMIVKAVQEKKGN